MDAAGRTRLVQIIAEVQAPVRPEAADAPGTPAEVVCKGCLGFFSWREVGLDEVDCGFLCRRCQGTTARRNQRRRVLKVLAAPFFWVGLLGLIGGVAYALGMGQPDLAGMAKRDAQKPWFQQRVTWLHVQQGSRVRLRLALPGGVRREARWAALGKAAYDRAIEDWKGTEAEAHLHHLRLAAAMMQAKMGDPAAAWREAVRLEPDFRRDALNDTTYYYLRGTLALAAGQRRAGQDDLERVLLEAGNKAGELVDFRELMGMMEAGAGGLSETVAGSQLATMVGTKQPPGELVRAAIRALEEYGIKSPIAKATEQAMKREGTWNKPEEGVIVKPGK